MTVFIPTQPTVNTQALKMSERLLLERLLNNEIGAFNQLYKMYAPSLLGVIMEIIDQRETAEDLLQEVFLKIKKYLPAYDDQKSRLFTWMFNISRNTAIDYLRLKPNGQRKSTFETESFSYSLTMDTIGVKTLINKLSLKIIQKT